MKRIALITIIILTTRPLFAQHSEPSTIKAYPIQNKITFDGMPSEAVWSRAMHISNFTQRELNYGQPVSEKTEVAVLYNDKGLYFGIWCYQKDPSQIVAKNLNVDFDFWSDDNFQILISPFNDNKTGYLFIINPNGARADLQVYGGEDANRDWNGVWDAKATITDKGWFAEVFIPFNTLQFKKSENMTWAVNFERDIMAKHEQALWQGWSRDNSIFSVVNAGKLTGLKGISYAYKFEFKPYLLGGLQYEEGAKEPVYRMGGDLNINLTPTLKLNLTSFTDFAQVEVDRIPVNLSRFNVYYPEKRQFFLEGENYFSYYLGDRNMAFYTRQIGIEGNTQVPILGGVRLFGKVGKENIGFLNIQEMPYDTLPSSNNTIFRYKHEVGKQSYVGGIFTNKYAQNQSSQTIGVDAAYITSSFLKNKNLVISGKITTVTKDFKTQKNALSYYFYADYPNDLIDNYMAIGSMQKNFMPELGFIRRTDYNSYAWFFRIMPRVWQKYGIKRLLLKPWGFLIYYNRTTGELESLYNETRPLGAVFKSGERFEINFIQNYDKTTEAFDLTDDVSVPAGAYKMFSYELQFETYKARPVWVELLYNFGDFYGGTKNTLESSVGINLNKHLNLSEEYTYNHVVLPQGTVITHEVASYLNLAFNTKLNLSLFAQYNSLEDMMLYNFRLHWIPKIGSDFYLVYNIGYNEPVHQIEYMKPSVTAAVAKIVYRFTF